MLALRRPGRFRPLEQWFFRATRYAAENDRRLDDLSGWDGARSARSARCSAACDGVEVDAATPTVGPAAVFAADPDALAQAGFVAFRRTTRSWATGWASWARATRCAR